MDAQPPGNLLPGADALSEQPRYTALAFQGPELPHAVVVPAATRTPLQLILTE